MTLVVEGRTIRDLLTSALIRDPHRTTRRRLDFV